MQRNVQRPRTSIFPECPRHRRYHLQTSDWARTHTNNYITNSICWRQKHRLSPYSPSRLNRPYFCCWPVAVVPDEQQTSRRAATGSARTRRGSHVDFQVSTLLPRPDTEWGLETAASTVCRARFRARRRELPGKWSVFILLPDASGASSRKTATSCFRPQEKCDQKAVFKATDTSRTTPWFGFGSPTD